MPDPWLALTWTLVAVLAIAYAGATVQAYVIWAADAHLWWQHVLAAALALVWPWAIGAALVRWIKEMA